MFSIPIPDRTMKESVRHTIVDVLLVGKLALVALQQTPQAVANFTHHTFASRSQLCQIIRLLHQGIQGANLEGWNAELRGGAFAAYRRL
jgi:hypothetical protein